LLFYVFVPATTEFNKSHQSQWIALLLAWLTPPQKLWKKPAKAPFTIHEIVALRENFTPPA
jgi:hypothetical protein